MKQYFLKLYQYNNWANLKVMESLEKQGVNNEKILRIFSHQLSANFIWLNRIKGEPKAPYELWKTYDLIQLRKMAAEAGRLWMQFVNENENFDRVLKYHNYTGEYFENNVEHIMMHLVNHGTYHRGQVAMLLRQSGYKPVNTDLITWDRIQSGQLKD